MSKEAIEMIRKMDMEQVENQFVLQCAPLIAGLKMSNLFIIRKNHLRRLCALLQNSGIRCRVLYLDGDKLRSYCTILPCSRFICGTSVSPQF